MSGTLRSELLGTAGLMIAAIAAAVLTLVRQPVHHRKRNDLLIVFALLIALQAVHFIEEYATGFHQRFPFVLGLPPWPAQFFLAFNIACLVVWCVSAASISAGYRLAFFPAWFLALAGMANGVVHPLLALASGAYFPGLLTSPLVGVAGVMLWKRLIDSTGRARV